MKKIISTTILLALGLGLYVPTVNARHLSASERQEAVADFRQDLYAIIQSPLDQQTRVFLLRQLLEQINQVLTDHDQDDRPRDDDDDDIDNNREYNRVVDAVEEYLEVEEDEDDFDIESVRRYRDGYRVYVELDNGDDVVVELDDDYDVVDYYDEDSDDRNDNSDSDYVDDDTRVYDDEIEFRLAFDLSADRRDIYIERDIEAVLEFEIVDEDGDVVADEDDLDRSWLSARMDSSADTDGDYYVIEEDEEEEFEFIISFEPDDENEEYRLELNRLGYNDDDRPANDYLNFRNNRYVTDYYSLD